MEKEQFYAEADGGARGPLEGIRVLEATNYAAGPVCGMILSDLGAESLKCEMPGKGDPNRGVPPFVARDGDPGLESSAVFMSFNRGKKSITLDFRKPEGQEIFRKLAVRADIVVENFAPGTMGGWGLGYADLKAVKPDIIYVSISGFGQFGPLHRKKAFDPVGQAMGGIMAVTGEKGGGPVRCGTVLADDVTGWQAAIGALAALQYRNRTGKGQLVDASMTDAVLYLTDMGVMGTANAGWRWERNGNGIAGAAPSGTYLCRDGEYVYIFAAFDAHWERLCRIMGREDLLTDSRANSYRARLQNEAFVDEAVAQWARTVTVAEAMAVLDEADVVASPILGFSKIIDNEHYLERESIVDLEHPLHGKLRHFGVATKYSLTPARLRSAAPRLGQHTEETLRGIGLDESAIEALKAKKII